MGFSSGLESRLFSMSGLGGFGCSARVGTDTITGVGRLEGRPTNRKTVHKYQHPHPPAPSVEQTLCGTLANIKPADVGSTESVLQYTTVGSISKLRGHYWLRRLLGQWVFLSDHNYEDDDVEDTLEVGR